MQTPSLGYLVAAAIGAIIAVVVGFLVYSIPTGPADSQYFSTWLMSPLRYSVIYWVVTGIAVGCGLRYLAASR